MRRNRKLYATALAVMLCLGASGTAAEPTLDITDISADKGLISVETVNNSETDTTFTLTVSKDSGADGADKYYAVYMEDVAAGKAQLFQFKIPDDKNGIAGSGSYTVYLKNYEGQRVSKLFEYADGNDVAAFFSLLKTEADKITEGIEPHTLLLPVVNAAGNQDVYFSIGFDYGSFAGESAEVQQQTMNLLYKMGLNTMSADDFPQAMTQSFGTGLYNNGEQQEGILLLSLTYNNTAIDTALIDETITAMKNSYATVDVLKDDFSIAYGLATIKTASTGIMANTLAAYSKETGLCGEIIGKIAALSPLQARRCYEEIVLSVRNNGLQSNQELQALLENVYKEITDGGTTAGGGAGGGTIGGKDNSTPVKSGSVSVGAGMGSGTTEEKVESFNDLSQSHWAYESVKWLKNRGIVNGTDNGTFEPNRQVTREEFAKMIVLACGINVKNQTADFTDLAADAWYVPYIGAATDAGIVGGTGNNNFGIGMNITRQDMAVMVKRALDAKAVELVKAKDYTAFEDEGVFAEYATDAIKMLFEADVINGKGNGVFDPAGTATRAEAAKIIYEAFKGVAI